MLQDLLSCNWLTSLCYWVSKSQYAVTIVSQAQAMTTTTMLQYKAEDGVGYIDGIATTSSICVAGVFTSLYCVD